MSNMYTAYGPMPTNMGVSTMPRLNGSLDRRALMMGRSATLGRSNPAPLSRYPQPALGCSYQDLRRSREFLDIKHGPMEPMQPFDSMSVAAGMLGDSIEGFPTPPTTLERRRNGGVATACSVHGGGTLSRPGSRRGSRYDLAEERRGGCCGRSCCTLTFSILACLLILSGVIIALYFFIKHVPHEPRQPIQEEPCEHCEAWGGVCVMDQEGVANCTCLTACPPPSSTTSPVCGRDGRTYATRCELRRHACSTQQHIHIKYTGPCDDDLESSAADERGSSKGDSLVPSMHRSPTQEEHEQPLSTPTSSSPVPSSSSLSPTTSTTSSSPSNTSTSVVEKEDDYYYYDPTSD